ncbi:sulfatase-like hydrolase/transferase [bacterium]|nr:sulfatase-like hydrolase/transferase [Akkermansiaceae bacterium]MDB4300686.1 sulfatase-like hydrolase/transferase [bacterium]MDB4294116.1 sulfatase-like hydrolase/transferase [Akkermansiaceae bacterium]MDB4295083.1 sulfatase-like hydrolase/transferase [Akkermansiaceae bacterium]MDB4313827.1 sulfatase-like hydrolase/transferase [Akkermansiaceae bacterium]
MKLAPLSLLSAVALSLASAAAEQPQKPNIVLIMTDDASWECFGPYGAVDYETPNIDRLAEHGVKFQHCYSTPICTPSRVMIMTGKYNFRNYTHFGYLPPQEKTFGNLLQEAGYKTAIAGKWQLNGIHDGDTLEGHADNSRVNRAGFDEHALWQVTRGKKGKGSSERFWSPQLEVNGQFLTSEQNQNKYGPDLMSDFICDFIKRHQDEPFFVYYPTTLVHDPFVPTPDTIGDRPRGPEANKAPKNRAQKKENFVAMVNYLDKIVGKIVNQLEEVGQLENTLIVFTSDNGTHTPIQSNWNGRMIKGGKGNTKNMGTHVPLIAYWKGKSAVGSVCEDLVDFTDVYPTLAKLAGVELGEDDPQDGQSFLPQILGLKTTPRTHVLCHYQPYMKFGSKNAGAFVRTDRFKLYADGRFYDIARDLDEAKDLAKSLNKEKEQTAHKQLKALIDQIPPVPQGGRESTVRPLHPEWPLMK